MKPEDLVDFNGKQLKALTDDELLLIFKDLLKETRPDQVRERKAKQQSLSKPIQLQPSKQLALKALEEAGVDMSFIDIARRRRKR